MPDGTTSMHWHGINQYGSQYSDGVPYVTQCPISPGTTFRYVFKVDIAGTNFYHSHTAVQKVDGLVGPLIVKEIEQEEPLLPLYDEDLPEHVIMIQDWTKIPGEHFIPGVRNGSRSPSAYLINGRSMYYLRNSSLKLPLSEFIIEKGKRYRFRLIGSTCLTCAVVVKFQGHRVLAISADGGLRFKPIPVDTIVLNSGERFDVILEANQTEDLYLLHLQSLGKFCSPEPYVALLSYKSVVEHKSKDIGLPKPLSYEELGVIFNAVMSTCDGKNSNEVCISHLEGVEDAIEHKLSKKSYHQLHIALGEYQYDDDDLFRSGTYQPYDEPADGVRVKVLVNNISFMSPPSPLISQFYDIPKNCLCQEECYQPTKEKPCSCVNLYSIPLGAVVDLIIYDTDDRKFFSHPMHLHGYNFYLLEMGVLKENNEDKRMELASISKKLKEDNLNLKLRPMRDSISIPAGGYALVRFIANNPGFWLIHCHYAFHLDSGMAAVLKIGEKHHLPEIPNKFPKCGNFMQNVL
ncbi:unnamed protein product [Nezara viridula]|nr:unnamed protein product [Nezara viridula]